MIHKPSTKVGFYGADVSGPVFKDIAQKIFTDTPNIDVVNNLDDAAIAEVESHYDQFYEVAQKYKTIMPDVTGMPAMDAMTLLENMGMKVELKGSGKVKEQSVAKGTKLKKSQTIILQLS